MINFIVKIVIFYYKKDRFIIIIGIAVNAIKKKLIILNNTLVSIINFNQILIKQMFVCNVIAKF